MTDTDENVNVQLKYSKSGTPYIDGPFGRIIFSNATKTKKGYRYLVINHVSEESFINKGQRFFTTIKESYVKKIDFTTSGQGDKKIPDYVMPKKLLNWFTKIFVSLSEGEYFPESNIDVLKGIIDDTDFDVLYAKKQKKRRVKRA